MLHAQFLFANCSSLTSLHRSQSSYRAVFHAWLCRVKRAKKSPAKPAAADQEPASPAEAEDLPAESLAGSQSPGPEGDPEQQCYAEDLDNAGTVWVQPYAPNGLALPKWAATHAC